VFEVAYHVDADDLTLPHFRDVLAGRPTKSITRHAGAEVDAETVADVREFCAAHLKPASDPAVAHAGN
jgi:hypothetical protein